MTPTEKKELATQLRQKGYTYKEIAQETGYSVDWCKQNLKAVEKNSTEKQAIKEAVKLAQSNSGITQGEIMSLIKQSSPDAPQAEIEKAMRRFKAAINKEENTVIRPYWMRPEAAQESFNLMLSSVDSVQQSMDDAVLYVRKQLDLDQSYDKSIRYSIIQLLYCGGLSLDAVVAQCDRLSEIVNALNYKNNNTTESTTPLSTLNNITTQKCTLFGTIDEKVYCVDLHPAEDGSLVSLDDLDSYLY